MKNNLRLHSLILSGLVAALLFVIGCSAAETPEETYTDYDEAQADGGIERGWIPEWLPVTAVNIREKHDLDRNSSILVFAVDGPFVLPEQCEPAVEPSPAWLNADWWPDADILKLPVYDCGDGLLAVDEVGDLAYFWRL